MMFRKTLPPENEKGVIHIEGTEIPFLLLRSKKRRRTILFRLQGDKGVEVRAPRAASLQAVTKILLHRAPWILRQVRLREKQPSCDFRNGAVFPYLGHGYILRVTQGGGKPGCLLSPHHLHVHVPDADLSPAALGEEVKLEITLWLKKRARVKLKKRLDLWAARMGLDYKKLTVTGPERRWGSCSADNAIRLNWRLMMAPLPVIDYVAAHELAHVRHKNHSVRFWGFLAHFMPDWQARRKILRAIEQKPVL